MNYNIVCPYCGYKLLKATDGKTDAICSRCGEKFIIEIKGNSLDIELIQKFIEIPTPLKD